MSDPTADFLARYSPDIQAITNRLREMVMRAMPDVQEVLYADQDHFGYSFTGKSSDRIVYVCPLKNYVRLGLMRGAYLPDPEHKLVGEGKWLRHVKVRSLAEADHPAIEPLVRAAWVYADAERAKPKQR
jgi:hypothetical protein